ncbi:MAG: DUF6867 family protein [Methyloceanibacter sp.]
MEFLGTTWPVFITVTLVVMGFASFMTGQALANTWKPYWHAVVYAFMLGLADRFLHYSLFGGELRNILGYLVDSLVLLGYATLAYRLTRARCMVSQYPWLYEKVGPFSWREKS